MSTRLREIAASALGRLGLVGISEIHILSKAGTTGYQYWEQLSHSFGVPAFHTNLNTALGLMTTGRNDVLLVTPDNHVQAAQMVLSKSETHIVGMVPDMRMNQRARFTHAVSLPSFMEISGDGNMLANLYLSYGVNAADIQALLVSGDRNTLQSVHVLPVFATAMDVAGFDLIRLNCGEFFAKDCVFGGEIVAMTTGDLLSIYGAADRSNRSIFENCTFMMRADNAQANFIEIVGAGAGNGFSIFKNCQFINFGTSLTYAIDGAGLGAHQMFFDNACSFVGVNDIVALAYENYVWFGGVNMPINQVNTASSALFNGIACHPDVS